MHCVRNPETGKFAPSSFSMRTRATEAAKKKVVLALKEKVASSFSAGFVSSKDFHVAVSNVSHLSCAFLIA
jgi:hypothetical protein